jgi:uncharacterized protein YycO
VRIALYQSKGLLSRFIKWQTRSPFSHAALVFTDDLLVESMQGEGVRVRPWKRTPDADLFRVLAMPAQEERMREFALRQVGKPYDYTMVVRFVTREQETRKSKGKWFCSELVFAAFKYAGIDLLARTEPWEVSPGLLARSPLLMKD